MYGIDFAEPKFRLNISILFEFYLISFHLSQFCHSTNQAILLVVCHVETQSDFQMYAQLVGRQESRVETSLDWSQMAWEKQLNLCTSCVSWRRQWQPTPVLLPGKSHGRRSLVGCSPWGRQQSDTTERLHFHFSLSCIGEGNGNPLQYSCLENPRDGGAWWAAISGVAQSWTRLK